MDPNFIYKSFLDEFQKIVNEFPDSIAISSESGKISYSELNYQVIQYSHNLYEAGIRKGDVIALWMKKSPEYIASILAIWKLGAVFLPLDEKTPKARVDWICKDANAKLLITNDLLPQIHTDTEIEDFVTSSLGLPNIRALQSDDVAYIIYTSGSTGSPKGVVVPHEGIVNFLEKQIEVFQVTSKSKILQYLSIGFDASISEIGITLLAGAEIRIEKEEKIKTADGLISILEYESITHICLPPSLLPILPIQKMPSSLETIIIGGEVCPVETVRLWSQKFRLVNVYGPTEVTVCSSLVVCEPNWDKPLIGNPIPNRGFHILGEDLLEVRDGESGELYLSGVGLAKKYLNQSQLTQEKFLYINGIPMYKTGDRVLKHSSQKIEFLGRMDRQFKLRGNLIEPSEIERVLSSHPKISLVHVMKRKLQREILVAYLYLNQRFSHEEFSSHLDAKGSFDKKNDTATLIAEIKHYLSNFLPKWMIPDRFVFLEKIPLNANGKLDLNALPGLEMTRPRYLHSFQEPESEEEVQLTQIFERILGIYPVGIDDDFFILGGDSISMISLLSECALFGITLLPEKFIQNPTVKGILEKRSDSISVCSSIEFLKQEANLEVELLAGIQNTNLIEKKMEKVFLTGATGFLGSRILVELIQNTEAEIFCLVRSRNIQNGKVAIENILSNQGIKDLDWRRINLIFGDMTKPKLGLSEKIWEFLTTKIDTVFHFAAEVNLLLPYEALENANVTATKEILKFCLTNTRKYLHYASTLSVFVSTDEKRDIIFEADELDTMKEVYGGYAQTKWVSEKILLNAKQKGMNSVSIYRFGLITGDSKTGFGKKDDFLSRFLKSLLDIKVLPFELGKSLKVDITPVDIAAKACLLLAMTEKRESIFHIANPNPLLLSEIVSIGNDLNLGISYVSKEDFLKVCKEKNLENSYFYLSLSRLLLSENEFKRIRPLDLFQATGVRFDFTNAQKILPSYRFLFPKPDKVLLEKYFRF